MGDFQYDKEIIKVAEYVFSQESLSPLALETAKYSLIDSLGCAILALNFPACTKLLGPWVPNCSISFGARVPGTSFELDPIKAAFDIGALIRWLDFNDTWLAQEWGHPSDNLGGLLSVMDFVTRRKEYQRKYTMEELLISMVKAYEIQGVLALANSFNAHGIDHVILVKVATCALVTKLLGGKEEAVCDALSQVWIDGQSLRLYRHAPNTGSRKSWAAADATSRGVRLALLTLQGEKGYKSALSAKKWGFCDAQFCGKSILFERELKSFVAENILFKISYPAEFHAQTAIECAIFLHETVKHRLNEIKKITIYTHSAAIRIIDKKGPLYNPADRDHCLQYMVAVALINGKVTADSYEEEAAKDPLIDFLRDKMQVIEKKNYTDDYFSPQKRSITNELHIQWNDGSAVTRICEYPLGHKKRRIEAIPKLWEKFEKNISSYYSVKKTQELITLMQSQNLLSMSVSQFVDYWI